MSKHIEKITIIALVAIFVLGVYINFLTLAKAEGSSCAVQFTGDVVLDLDGLDTTVYIAEGSAATSLDISGNTLEVDGICDGDFFRLKTSEHTILQLAPSGGIADFVFSSAHVSGGYISQWAEVNAVSVTHTLKVSQANAYYAVKIDGADIGDSPFDSGASAELNFSNTGTGTYTIEITDAPSEPLGERDFYGWAWSENIGWVSFSSQNCSEDPRPEGCPVGEIPEYGVKLDNETGNLSGYAWSEHIGWIYFSPSGPYPGVPEYSAKYDSGTGKITGWAKVLSNDEWLKLGPIDIAGTDYGAEVIGKEVRNWAWGDTTVGWLSFNCANNNHCETSDYKVYLSAGDPQVLSLECVPDYCARTKDGAGLTSRWEDNEELNLIIQYQYYHPGDFDQEHIEVQIGESGIEGDFENKVGLVYDKKSVSNASSSTSTISFIPNILNDYVSGLAWGTTYYWRMRVYDSVEGFSNWSSIGGFTLDSYPHPYAHFKDPKPSKDEKVFFDGTDSEIYREGGTISYLWNFPGGDPLSSTNATETVAFSETGAKTITLEVRDNINSCTKSITTRVRYPLPDWRETTPFGG